MSLLQSVRPSPGGKDGDLLSDVSLVSKAQIRVIGFVMGLAAALVGITSVPGLTFLPSPSLMLIVLAVIITLLSPAGSTIGRHRLTIIDAAFIATIIARIFIEVFNAVDLNHAVYSAIAYGQIPVYLMTWPPRLIIRNRDDLGVFLRAFIWPAALVAIVALLQLLRFPGVTEWLIANAKSDGLEARVAEGREDLRATSTIGHWIYLGGYLAVATAIAGVDLLLNKAANKPRLASAGTMVLLGILLVGQITTLTFATIAVALAVVAVIVIRIGIRPIFAILIVASGFIAWSVFGEQLQYRIDYQATTGQYDDPALAWLPSTIAYRLTIWDTETIPAWLIRPWTGWGMQVYNFDLNWPQRPQSLAWLSPESQWLSTLITGGLLSLALLIFLLIATFVTVFRARKVLGKALSPVTALLVGLVVASTISSLFTAPGPPMILWGLIGALIPFAQRAQAGRRLADEEASGTVVERTSGANA
ncbi:O-antigen ligase family protein [Herbiconiux moechotypicola]|uniref:O-antigen ligase-related domain-containing protein n=1 Tax=Herbiconiux moechotypicola TaxID=637393 RepID=A0ABP5QQE4_9MICO|nr:O-antigen ligase family protein [Herbiconiux moechotypicola]MCS5731501.1 O-antigen ligase family protein [Herbiconiux moechotypicola]